MMIKFLAHGTGKASSAATYLLDSHDHKGEERAGVAVLRGDPQQFAAVADSLDFQHRYRSAVISWSEEEAPSDADDPELLNQIAGDDMVRGITIACGGFYGPQGRELRAPLADPELNQKIEAFEYNGLRVNNFEMESSALAGLSLLLGHKALTCCMVIANRRALSANTGYKSTIDNLIKVVLDRI